jgi:chromosomal replication initiator protein
MLQSFWKDFLDSLIQGQEKVPILLSVLKQTRPVELTETEIIIGCENQGTRFFLEKRRLEIEKSVKKHAGKSLEVRFVIVEPQKIKKKGDVPPLFNFQQSQDEILVRSGLHAKYSFENFAVSPSNQVAYAATQAVANSPGNAYNPLFLYGGVGVGKTHLAQSSARKILEKDKNARVFFCPGDQFMNELIESIRGKTTPRFRNKYRRLNVLIVDDIQFIAGKQTVQEEFFHTFNAVVSAGGQIILTSDRHPNEIKNLEDRLRSRFSGGLIVDVQKPDFELRTAILLIKAREKNIEIDIEAAKIISENIEDTRALEGTLLSIYAKILGIKERIDLEAVASFFSSKQKETVRRVFSTDVIRAVCTYYNIKQSHLKGPQRTESLALARQLAMYILRTKLNLKQEEVARMLKRKDHTTVIHAVEKISRLLTKDPVFKQDSDNIIHSLNLST